MARARSEAIAQVLCETLRLSAFAVKCPLVSWVDILFQTTPSNFSPQGRKERKGTQGGYLTIFATAASAHLSPSIAAETIPPAKPAPSPQGNNLLI